MIVNKFSLTQFGLYIISVIFLYITLYLRLPGISKTELGTFTVPEAWGVLTLLSFVMFLFVIVYVGFVYVNPKSYFGKIAIAAFGLVISVVWLGLSQLSVTDITGAGEIIPKSAIFISNLSALVFFSQVVVGWWLLFRKS